MGVHSLATVEVGQEQGMAALAMTSRLLYDLHRAYTAYPIATLLLIAAAIALGLVLAELFAEPAAFLWDGAK